MANLRREPGPFFFFLFVSLVVTYVMSMMFRTIASVTRTLEEALAPTAIVITALVIVGNLRVLSPPSKSFQDGSACVPFLR
jgi:ABC-type multidrug transport system permease subunit